MSKQRVPDRGLNEMSPKPQHLEAWSPVSGAFRGGLEKEALEEGLESSKSHATLSLLCFLLGVEI